MRQEPSRACIVKDGETISVAHNATIRDMDVTALTLRAHTPNVILNLVESSFRIFFLSLLIEILERFARIFSSRNPKK